MQKPWYQSLIEKIVPIGAGTGLLVGLIGFIRSAFDTVTLSITIAATIVLIITFFIGMISIASNKLVWVKNETGIRIKRVKLKLLLTLIGPVIVCWLIVGIKHFLFTSGESGFKENTTIRKPVFDSNDARFKVLILPFKKESSFKEGHFDIGYVLARRLGNLSLKDTLPVLSYFLTDSFDLSNIISTELDSIQAYHNADMVVLGSYSAKCDPTDSGEVCFNYKVRFDRWGLYDKKEDLNYKFTDISDIKEIRQGAGQESIDYVLYFVSGITAINKKEFKKALTYLKTIKNYENDTKCLNLIGLCHQAMHNLDIARRCYRNVLEREPNNLTATRNTGTCYLLDSNLHETAKWFRRTLKIDSTNYLMWHNTATILFRLRQYAEARQYFEKALRIDSTSEFTTDDYDHIAQCYLIENDIPNAIISCRRAISRNLKDENICFNLAGYFLRQRNFDSSGHYYEETLRFNHNNAKAHYFLGQSLLGLGRTKEGMKSFNDAINTNPPDDEVMQELGTIYLNNGDFPNAHFVFNKILTYASKSEYALLRSAQAYGIQKNRTQTLDFLSRLLKTHPSYKTQIKTDPAFKWLNTDQGFIALTK